MYTWQDPVQNKNVNPFVSKLSLSQGRSRALPQVRALQSRVLLSAWWPDCEGLGAKSPSWQVLQAGNPAGGLRSRVESEVADSHLQFSGVLSSYLFSGKQGGSPGPVPILSCFCSRQWFAFLSCLLPAAQPAPSTTRAQDLFTAPSCLNS